MQKDRSHIQSRVWTPDTTTQPQREDDQFWRRGNRREGSRDFQLQFSSPGGLGEVGRALNPGAEPWR
eukprot:2854183-Rhodomonas_salina.1